MDKMFDAVVFKTFLNQIAPLSSRTTNSEMQRLRYGEEYGPERVKQKLKYLCMLFPIFVSCIIGHKEGRLGQLQ